MEALQKAADEHSNIMSTNEIFGLSWSEDNPPQLPEDTENKLRLLMEEAPIEEVELETLQKEWQSIVNRIESQSGTALTDSQKEFSYSKIAPYLLSSTKIKVVVDREVERYEPEKSETIYITEQELLRIWGDHSSHALGKKEASYSAAEALLLLDEENEQDLMVDVSTLYDSDHDSSNSNNESDDGTILDDVDNIDISQLKTDLEDFPSEELEYSITQTELHGTWSDREEVKWGMPGGSYSDELALLLLDEDDDDDSSIYTYLDDAGNVIDAPVLDELLLDQDEEDDDDYTEEDRVEEEEDDDDDEPFDVDKVLAELTGELKSEVISAVGAGGGDVLVGGDLLDDNGDDIDIHSVGLDLGLLDDDGTERPLEDQGGALPPVKSGPVEVIPGAQYTGRENQLLRESLYRMYKDLEEVQFMRPPWKKER